MSGKTLQEHVKNRNKISSGRNIDKCALNDGKESLKVGGSSRLNIVCTEYRYSTMSRQYPAKFTMKQTTINKHETRFKEPGDSTTDSLHNKTWSVNWIKNSRETIGNNCPALAARNMICSIVVGKKFIVKCWRLKNTIVWTRTAFSAWLVYLILIILIIIVIDDGLS